MSERYASIDIGTNTLRLLVAESNSKDAYKVVHRDRAVTRLGGRFSEEDGLIDDDTASRTINVLGRFSNSLIKYKVNNVKAVGTSVIRRARNRVEFLNEVYKKTGLNVDVITGNDEALLTLKGVLQVISRNGRYVVMDVGGGSTEYILGCDEEEQGAYSIEMGVVSLTEEFILSDPPIKKEKLRLENKIKTELTSLISDINTNNTDLSLFTGYEGAMLVGTAGTPTTLAAIDQGMEAYKPELINGYQLSLDRLKAMYDSLSGLTLMERRKIPSLEKGREDVILAGILIILKTMELLDFKEMVVSDSGLLEGVMLGLIAE